MFKNLLYTYEADLYVSICKTIQHTQYDRVKRIDKNERKKNTLYSYEYASVCSLSFPGK